MEAQLETQSRHAEHAPLIIGRVEAIPLGLPLARPDIRVTIPLYEDPIQSGLQPETGGDFIIANYPAYIDPALLHAFGEKYGVKCKVTPFDDINTGIT